MALHRIATYQQLPVLPEAALAHCSIEEVLENPAHSAGNSLELRGLPATTPPCALHG